jgi:hypothetical protein
MVGETGISETGQSGAAMAGPMYENPTFGPLGDADSKCTSAVSRNEAMAGLLG